MKKIAAVFAVVALLALGGSAFAATNPFMDVPMNSWAYDAVVSLAARGVLSGYPDGLYKGKQSMTRYEAASAIARALAYIDMTKADKQDVEMLKKLVVEFKDELDALGVRVDALEADMAVFKKRLGGWRFSGQLRTDMDYRSTGDGVVVGEDYKEFGIWQNRMRLFIERWFGENEEMYFYARINAGAGHSAGDQGMNWRQFYVRVPIFMDAQLTAGRFSWHMESTFGDYIADPTGRYGVTTAWFSDYEVYGLGISKEFGMGRFRATVAQGEPNSRPVGSGVAEKPANAFMITANADFNFTENFKGNLGGQYIKNEENSVLGAVQTYNWSNVSTGWLGLQFDFMQGLSLAGSVYFQSVGENDTWIGDSGGTAYRVGLQISQDLLKFTNFYVQYAKMPAGFYTRAPGSLMITTDDILDLGDNNAHAGGFMFDANIFQVGAVQKWNDKWSTWLFYERLNAENTALVGDFTANGFGGGVVYYHNANTTFLLDYMTLRGDVESNPSRVRFTTQVTF